MVELTLLLLDLLLNLLPHQLLLGTGGHACAARGADQHASPHSSRPATSLPLRLHTQPPVTTSCDAGALVHPLLW